MSLQVQKSTKSNNRPSPQTVFLQLCSSINICVTPPVQKMGALTTALALALTWVYSKLKALGYIGKGVTVTDIQTMSVRDRWELRERVERVWMLSIVSFSAWQLVLWWKRTAIASWRRSWAQCSTLSAYVTSVSCVLGVAVLKNCCPSASPPQSGSEHGCVQCVTHTDVPSPSWPPSELSSFLLFSKVCGRLRTVQVYQISTHSHGCMVLCGQILCVLVYLSQCTGPYFAVLITNLPCGSAESSLNASKSSLAIISLNERSEDLKQLSTTREPKESRTI